MLQPKIQFLILGLKLNSLQQNSKMKNLSFEISKYPRDLLQILMGNDPKFGAEEEDDDEGLNLGLGYH